MLTKNLPALEALWKIFLRIGLNEVFAFKALFSGDVNTFVALFKAHLHFIKWLIFETHIKSQSNKNATLHGVYRGLVIWQYFIKKRKIFSEIVRSKVDI